MVVATRVYRNTRLCLLNVCTCSRSRASIAAKDQSRNPRAVSRLVAKESTAAVSKSIAAIDRDSVTSLRQCAHARWFGGNRTRSLNNRAARIAAEASKARL